MYVLFGYNLLCFSIFRLLESQKEFQEAVEKIQFLKKTNGSLEGAKSELLDKVAALTSRKQQLEQV